jgi:ComF family protein
MKMLRAYIKGFLSLIFPNLCPACGEELVAGEDVICTDCRYHLPQTNFHLQADNIVARQFWGKIKLEGAYALYYFTKGGKVQNLMHHFKYKGMHKIGNITGNIAGEQLSKSQFFAGVDYVIPVPLHKTRLRERGYNQAACFGQGLADRLNAVVEEDNLIRTRATKTQTKRSRFARFENMKEVFAVADPEKLKGKHILLVDDIVTTGSTLEACAIPLLAIPGLKLSIAAIAYAE